VKAKVNQITPGSVNSEVLLELSDGQQLVSIITKHSVDGLGLTVGKNVYAVVKASNVMIGVDEE
jgi:molybdopterin-binding protein